MKRNQVMITALAIMIAVAGYLNFAGDKIGEETLVVSDHVMTEDEMTALLDLSQEDIASDIESLDAEAILTEDYMDKDMAQVVSEVTVDLTANAEEGEEDVVVADNSNAVALQTQGDNETGYEDISIQGTPGEAVFTSTQAVSTLSAAKLLKEQTRARNKEALEKIMNNTALGAEQKQEAVDSMVALTDLMEKEMEAEILLAAKGFSEAVVSISENSVDVVVCTQTLSDAQLAQIMDIVTRKTQMGAEQVIISQVTQK